MTARLSFDFEAGALVRSSAMHTLRSAADKCGLTLTEVSNDGGWLSTRYRFRADGETENVRRFQQWLETAWLDADVRP